MSKFTLFSQIISKLDRTIFNRLVIEGETDKHNKGYNSWTHIDLESSQKHAQQIMWAFKKKDAVKKEGTRMLKKHVNMPKNL